MKVEGQGPDKPKKDTMKSNFLLVSLEEKKAKKIAEVINNDTARKILDHLANKDCTESDISKELGIPISTVHYNLKQLQEANLVTVEEFHYSEKGKEVNHYSLANKYIIIAPKSDDGSFLAALKKIIPLTIITAGVALVMQLYSKLSFASYAKSAAPSLMMREAASDAGIQAANIAGSANATAMPVASAKVANYAAGPTYTAIQQSNTMALFLVGAISIIIIYFIYEWVKKK